MTTTVINLKGHIRDYGPQLQHAPAGLIYVGRRCTMGGWRLETHLLHNPHTTRFTGCAAPGCHLRHDQTGVVRAYALELPANAQAFTLARASADATLACWCPPDICHTDVIAAVADAPGHVEAVRVLDAIANDPLAVLRPLDADDVTHVFLARIDGTVCDCCESAALWEARLSGDGGPLSGDVLTVCAEHLPRVNEWVAGLGRPAIFHDSVMQQAGVNT